VRAVAAGLGDVRAPWYKKIDSTLRGNIAAELAALLEALGAPCAVVCPAFPAQGRGMEAGRLVAPSLGLADLHLPSLLEAAGLPVAAIDLDEVRAGAGALGERLRSAAAGGARLLAPDALSDDDLATIERATSEALPGALRCGSAGLLGAVAARLRPTSPKGEATFPAPPGPALVVVGSASAAARRQIEALRGQCNIFCMGGEEAPKASGDALLHLPPPPPGAPLDGPAAQGIAARLAEAAVRLVAQLDPGLLVLVGGDTAAATLALLGVERLPVERELLPGMPLARVQIAGRERAVALKAGNHGDDGALRELLRLARE
jgi:4-hydroxythreonine-4-phosphate dehydrogenase